MTPFKLILVSVLFVCFLIDVYLLGTSIHNRRAVLFLSIVLIMIGICAYMILQA